MVNVGSISHGVINVGASPLGGLVLACDMLWQMGEVVQMTGFIGMIPCRWWTISMVLAWAVRADRNKVAAAAKVKKGSGGGGCWSRGLTWQS